MGLESVDPEWVLKVVLVDIISHLDSGSLLNLSLTSKIIRDVIALELDNKGIVVPRWRRRGNNLPGWEVSEFVWKLSTGFEAVRDWKFEDNLHAVTEHLKTCPCFVRSVPTEIVMLCGKVGDPVSSHRYLFCRVVFI
ncbi:unnamed protein product [Notodromas monacha]|uniref:F-box domain-containing protein n=1 Tax=Notodromas monacha TaxID=399045 RepID=A0A7R9GI13_9CRUS|nr:unnamed protein product [Notodromas monacha]CAG0922096.1 unnamed protein product [Notodromas monacha]